MHPNLHRAPAISAPAAALVEVCEHDMEDAPRRELPPRDACAPVELDRVGLWRRVRVVRAQPLTKQPQRLQSAIAHRQVAVRIPLRARRHSRVVREQPFDQRCEAALEQGANGGCDLLAVCTRVRSLAVGVRDERRCSVRD